MKLGEFINGQRGNHGTAKSIDEVVTAAVNMGKSKVGALIIFERDTNLGEIIRTGTVVDYLGNKYKYTPRESAKYKEYIVGIKNAIKDFETGKWSKTYLEDLYDVNTRILTAYVHLEGKPNPEWLRRFYWFDNTIWRLNKIIDWNISSNDKTRCEFIKVEDRNNYTSITQDNDNNGDIWFGMPPNWRVPQIGGAIPIQILTNLPNVEWFLINNNEGVTTSISSGTGSRDILLDIEPNNGDRPKPIQISAVVEGGKTVNLVLYQSYDNETNFTINPNIAYHFALPHDIQLYAGGGVNFGLVSDLNNTAPEGIMGKFGINALIGAAYQYDKWIFALDFKPGYGHAFCEEPSIYLAAFDWKLGLAVRYKL